MSGCKYFAPNFGARIQAIEVGVWAWPGKGIIGQPTSIYCRDFHKARLDDLTNH